MESVADPGFPIGGMDPSGECGPLTGALFGENVCENERIGSVGGVYRPLYPPMGAKVNRRCSCFLLRIYHSVGKLILKTFQ